MKTVTITVTGKVQGVWFRKYTLDKAVELNITGTVKNLPDNSVYIVATGTEEQLELLTAWCWQGSPKSKVEHVITTAVNLVLFDSFSIKQ